MSRQVVVVGAGIAGSALAAELAAHDDVEVTVVDRGPADRLLGSTGHAPGFIGLLGEAPVLTGLARTSADVYAQLRWDDEAGFDRVGGLEVAQTDAALAVLERRAGTAEQAGLPARLLTAEQAAAASPLVDARACVGGLLFADDGTARATAATAALRQRAEASGATFVHGAGVTGVDVRGGERLAVRAGERVLLADDVVLAGGVWGAQVAALAGVDLPIVPVAHPYVHGPQRAPGGRTGPFVRWPEHHVYARDHGDRLGLGSYDHVPVPVSALGETAELPWPEVFDDVVERALALLPEGQRFPVAQRLNGVFAMTPDNQPLLGAVEDVPGLWVAQALWVTHAAGAARCLAALMDGGEVPVDGVDALRPDRFAGRDDAELTAEALRLYRDIYATG